MNSKQLMKTMSARLALVLLLGIALRGCGQNEPAPEPAETAANTDAAEPAAEPEQESEQEPAEEATEPIEEPEEEPVVGPAEGEDGYRFESVIVLEGSEETVRYEHVRNEALGFELDYEYEILDRVTEADRECFVSRYDDPEDPQNYLEVTFSSEDADTASKAVYDALAETYDTIVANTYYIIGAGWAVEINASGSRTDRTLQTVYVIIPDEGCPTPIVTIHYTAESAEGFGVRFDRMLDSFTLINR